MQASQQSDSVDSKSPSFAQPFGFAARLQRPKSGLDLLPVLDLIVTALFIGLLFTRFVMTPGVRVDLPVTDMRVTQAYPAIAVMTISHSGMFFFNGRVYDAASIRPALERFIRDSAEEEVALLMKMEGDMDVQEFLELCEAAQTAGFRQVQISGRRPDAQAPGFQGGFNRTQEPAPKSLFLSP